jgi:hypothetical protein
VSVGEADRQLLEAIMEALSQVGGELDAADHFPDHDPWLAVARQEAVVSQLAGHLSEGFRSQHPALARRLDAATSLHLSWGSLQDQLRRILSPGSSSSPDISS